MIKRLSKQLILFNFSILIGIGAAFAQQNNNETPDYECLRQINQIILNARLKLGCKYEWASSGPKTFDCSGLVQYAFQQAGITLTRTTITQCEEGDIVFQKKKKKGDIVFFLSGDDTNKHISHVGIAITDYANGDFKFIHASSANKCVCISSFTDSKYKKTYGGARRIINCGQ